MNTDNVRIGKLAGLSIPKRFKTPRILYFIVTKEIDVSIVPFDAKVDGFR
jgi:hypothetical protein